MERCLDSKYLMVEEVRCKEKKKSRMRGMWCRYMRMQEPEEEGRKTVDGTAAKIFSEIAKDLRRKNIPANPPSPPHPPNALKNSSC